MENDGLLFFLLEPLFEFVVDSDHKFLEFISLCADLLYSISKLLFGSLFVSKLCLHLLILAVRNLQLQRFLGKLFKRITGRLKICIMHLREFLDNFHKHTSPHSQFYMLLSRVEPSLLNPLILHSHPRN